jgi:hypothetical protein
MLWQRFDGQSVHSSAGLEQQFQVDMATCRAVAINAGNGVPDPVPIQPRPVMTQSVTVNTYPGGAMMPPAPSPPPPPDMSGFQNGMNNLATGIRRGQTEGANMEACMAQRGYHLVPAPSHS